MAYRRRQGITRASTFKEDLHLPENDAVSSPSSAPATKAIRASSALRESSVSLDRHHRAKEFNAYEESGDSKTGFWGVLARKAKAMLDDEIVVSPQHEAAAQNSSVSFNNSMQNQQSYQANENGRKSDNHKFRKGLDAIASSLNHIGDTFEKAFEEGRTIVENKTADIIQETRRLQIKRQGQNVEAPYQAHHYGNHNPWQPQMQPTQPLTQANQETQLKASRDVAMATAAKAKLLLRELKTVKADLAFAKERCSQLEEENKMLRENRDKGDHREDDELIRLQLETLLAEKSRLANENSIYARENRFLREIVEYHQLTMQDVVYLDECSEEVTEVYPVNGSSGISRVLSITPRSSSSEDLPSSETPHETEQTFPYQNETQEIKNVFILTSKPSPEEEDTKRVLESEDLPETEDIVALHNLLSSETPPETEDIFAPHNQSREIKSAVVLTSGSSPEEEDTKRHLKSEDLTSSGILPQTEEIFPPRNRFQDIKTAVVLTSGPSLEEEHTERHLESEDDLSSGILPETEQIFAPQNRFQETKSVVFLASDPSPDKENTRRPAKSSK